MACEYCGQVGSHDYRCSNYEPLKSNHDCSVCKESILIGEEYIVNNDNEYAHWECVDYAKDLAKFFGYEIKEMEDENY